MLSTLSTVTDPALFPVPPKPPTLSDSDALAPAVAVNAPENPPLPPPPPIDWASMPLAL